MTRIWNAVRGVMSSMKFEHFSKLSLHRYGRECLPKGLTWTKVGTSGIGKGQKHQSLSLDILELGAKLQIILAQRNRGRKKVSPSLSSRERAVIRQAVRKEELRPDPFHIEQPRLRNWNVRGLYLQYRDLQSSEHRPSGASDMGFWILSSPFYLWQLMLHLPSLSLRFLICKMELSNYIFMKLLWGLIQTRCLNHLAHHYN